MRSLILQHLPAAWGWMLVPTYKLMLSASILIGCWWIVRRLKAKGWDEGLALNLLVLAVVGSMLGSKLLYLLQYGPGLLLTSGAVFEIRSGGYSLYGGLIGGCLPPFIYLRWKRLDAAAFADACAPAMALGLALTRIGCFLRGCNFGSPTDLPWGVSFPPDSEAFAKQVGQNLVAPDAAGTLPVHPAQLYEVLLGLILLTLALKWAPGWRYSGRPQLIAIYAVARFGMEFLRADSNGAVLGPLNFPQLVSLCIVLFCTVTYIVYLPSAALGRLRFR